MRPRRGSGRALARVSLDTRVPATRLDTPSGRVTGGFDGELRTYAEILRRRAKWATWTIFLVLSAAFAYTMTQPPVYRATALIAIRGGDDGPPLEALFPNEDPTSEYLRTRFGLMTSTTLANRVIDELDLDQLEEFNPGNEAERQQIINRFLERLVVDPVESSGLVMVHFDAGSPELAARIVNQVISTYAQLRVESQERAAGRVAQQADSVRVRLAGAEAELRAFAVEHGLPYLVEEDLTTQIGTRLADLRARLADAEGTRYESESLYDAVVREGRRDLVGDEALQTLELRRAELRGEYARITATFQDSYPAAGELRRQIEHVEGLIAEERDRLADRVESDYRLALQREAMLAGAIDEQEDLASELGPQSGDYHVLRQAVLANRALYSTLLERRRQAEIVAAIGPTDLEVIDAAAPPHGPHRPVFAMNMGLALMLGMVLGVFLAFGREVFDDTVHTGEDFPISEEVPVLAMIPTVTTGAASDVPFQLPRGGGVGWLGKGDNHQRNGGWHRIDKVHPTGRALADAFGALRTAVLFDQGHPLPRTILVTSCRVAEGKTTVSVNLAMSLAQLGDRVLLIDADLRRPAVHRAFHIPARPGLAHCLGRGVRYDAVVQESVAPGLDVLPSGGSTTRAGDLLAGPRMGPLLREAEEAYDYVICDAPALFINAADARVLAQLVDGVVVVVRSRSTPRALVDRIPRAVPNVIGVVVNDLKQGSLPGYFAQYFDGYGETGDELGDEVEASASASDL
jgi:polysaccharide biosynthesis transport protein